MGPGTIRFNDLDGCTFETTEQTFRRIFLPIRHHRKTNLLLRRNFDLDLLTEPAHILASAAGVGSEFFLPNDERGQALKGFDATGTGVGRESRAGMPVRDRACAHTTARKENLRKTVSIIVGAAIDGTHCRRSATFRDDFVWHGLGQAFIDGSGKEMSRQLPRVHRRRISWIKDRAFRRGNRNRAVRAFIPRRIGIESALHRVCRIGVGIFHNRVQTPVDLLRRTVIIDVQGRSIDGDGAFDMRLILIKTVCIQNRSIGTIRHHFDRLTHCDIGTLQ